MDWIWSYWKPKRRALAGALALVLAAILVVALCAQGGAEDEFDRRLEQLGKDLQEAISSGKPPPPDLLQEIQKLMQQAQQREAQDAGDWTPFGENDGWRRVPFTGTITVSRRVSFGGAGLSKRETGFMRVQITGTQEIDEAGKTQLYPTGMVTTRISGREHWDLDGGSMTHTYSLTGQEKFGYDPEKAPQRFITFEVNDEEKLCRLDLGPANAHGQCTTVVRAGINETTSTSEMSTDIAAWFEDGCGTLEDESFSLASGILTDDYQMTGYQVIGSPCVRDGDGAVWRQGDPIFQQARQQDPDAPIFPVNYHVTYSISTRDKRPRVVFEPGEAYEKWLPALDEAGDGSTISVTARIVDPPDAKGTIRFDLRDVSEEPGTCLNHPAQGADTDPDLEIPQDRNGEELKVDEGGQSAETTDEVADARAVVEARDWGAYGKLYATATINLGGQMVDVPAIYEKTGAAYITIPLDEDDNSVADEWQQQRDAMNCGGDSDDDEQPQGQGPGDGLGVYEEYRGVRVKGQHTRLDPKTKDLFVYDEHGLVADSYLESITEPLKVHYVEADEMRVGAGERVINFNHDRYHLVDQHVLHVKRDQHATSQRHNWGLCRGPGAYPGPPGSVDPYVSIFTGQIEQDIRQTYQENKNAIWDALAPFRPNDAWLADHLRNATRMVTAHECCHGLDVNHHYKTLPPNSEPGEASPSYGWLVCVMRYPWEGGTAGEQPINYVNEVIYILQGKWPWGNRLCNTMDDCASQLVISDEGS